MYELTNIWLGEGEVYRIRLEEIQIRELFLKCRCVYCFTVFLLATFYFTHLILSKLMEIEKAFEKDTFLGVFINLSFRILICFS